MLNSISRLGETRPEQEWSNGTEFSGFSAFPEKRVHSKRIPKFSKTFRGIFTVPFNFGPEISEFLPEWKAPMDSTPDGKRKFCICNHIWVLAYICRKFQGGPLRVVHG